jgi:hypothetical protein
MIIHANGSNNNWIVKREEERTYIVQNDIVCRDAISRDKEQCLLVDLEDFANFAGSDFLDVVLAEVHLGDRSG